MIRHLEQHCLPDTSILRFARVLAGISSASTSCDVCQAVLPAYIEAELNNRPPGEYRDIRQHLEGCPTCAAAYLDLVEIALAAEEGSLPVPALPIDLSFLNRSGRSSANAE